MKLFFRTIVALLVFLCIVAIGLVIVTVTAPEGETPVTQIIIVFAIATCTLIYICLRWKNQEINQVKPTSIAENNDTYWFHLQRPSGKYDPELKALEIIAECKRLATQINCSKSVDEFESAYTHLVDNLEQLAWINEKNKVFMEPTARCNFEKMQSNMNATVNDLIHRVKINSMACVDIEHGFELIEKFLYEFKNSELLQNLATEENKKNVEQLYIEAKGVKDTLEHGRIEEERKKVLGKIGVKGNLDFSTFDPLEVIRAMEESIDRVYRMFIDNALPARQGEMWYKEFEEACKSSKLPLAAEIRLESLLAEYKPKFSNPNPLCAVDEMEGHKFEYWCASLLRQNGFKDVEVTPGSNDQGVDIIALKDGIRYAIQCKCYASNLGNTPVQEVNTGKAMYNCQVGAVMTNRYFTDGAKALAERNGVLLWDRDKIEQMIQLTTV